MIVVFIEQSIPGRTERINAPKGAAASTDANYSDHVDRPRYVSLVLWDNYDDRCRTHPPSTENQR